MIDLWEIQKARANQQVSGRGSSLAVCGADGWDVKIHKSRGAPKGRKNGKPRRYDEAQVRAIRAARAEGETFVSIGRRFGCGGHMVKRIVSRRAYGWVA